MFITYMQNDFCKTNRELYVKGAEKDTGRLGSFLTPASPSEVPPLREEDGLFIFGGLRRESFSLALQKEVQNIFGQTYVDIPGGGLNNI